MAGLFVLVAMLRPASVYAPEDLEPDVKASYNLALALHHDQR